MQRRSGGWRLRLRAQEAGAGLCKCAGGFGGDRRRPERATGLAGLLQVKPEAEELRSVAVGQGGGRAGELPGAQAKLAMLSRWRCGGGGVRTTSVVAEEKEEDERRSRAIDEVRRGTEQTPKVWVEVWARSGAVWCSGVTSRFSGGSSEL